MRNTENSDDLVEIYLSGRNTNLEINIEDILAYKFPETKNKITAECIGNDIKLTFLDTNGLYISEVIAFMKNILI